MTAMDAARTSARRRAPGLRSAALVGVAVLCLSACATATTAGGDGSPTDAAASGSASHVDDASPPAPIPSPTTIAESYARNDAADVAPAARDASPGRLLVTTWGSSSCPDLPVSAEWDADRTVLTVRAAFENGQAETPCTRDYVPTTSVVAVDDLPATEFTVRINGTDTLVPAAQ
ncbi:hypothetical protein ACGIF2_16495 [Cellulomonas sp. P22]|uniref:hypothetical protein n=1 Tax=Cellulomonas sp. P22 TaxID=3373189 RepID=UPI0037B67651